MTPHDSTRCACGHEVAHMHNDPTGDRWLICAKCGAPWPDEPAPVPEHPSITTALPSGEGPDFAADRRASVILETADSNRWDVDLARAYLALTQRPVDILSDEWWAKEVQAT